MEIKKRGREMGTEKYRESDREREKGGRGGEGRRGKGRRGERRRGRTNVCICLA